MDRTNVSKDDDERTDDIDGADISFVLGKLKDVSLDSPATLMLGIFNLYGSSDTDVQQAIKDDINACCAAAARLAGSDDKEAVMLRYADVKMALSTLYYIRQMMGACYEARDILKRGPVPVQAVVVKQSRKQACKRGDDDANQVQEAKSSLVAGISRFVDVDPTETNRHQQLYLYLLESIQKCGYRRHGSALYKQHRIPKSERGNAFDTYDTRAWVFDCEISEFVYLATRKETNFDMWLNMTHGRFNLSGAVDYLKNCRDEELPDLRKDRTVFAFSNGIYLARLDKFLRYGTPEHAALGADTVAARYFDLAAPDAVLACTDVSDHDSIPTPHLQSILDFQGMDSETSFWMYAMIGRLIYDVGDLDRWQVIPFLKGAASTGKSTIVVHVCRRLYDLDDVGVLSNNIEKKFGLSALVDKLLFIGPEIKNDIQLEQAEFQSIVSGESIQIATKFMAARTVEWRTPGILAGNQVPGWVDNSGSITRRMMMFDFPNSVKNGDMNLSNKLEIEMPTILIKANRCYLRAVALHSAKNIWTVVPASMMEAKSVMLESVNSIVGFLGSGRITFDAKAYMPFDQFKIAYDEYVRGMSIRGHLSLSKENITHPLTERGCRLDKNQTVRVYPREGPGAPIGRPMNAKFVVGCDFADNGMEQGQGQEEDDDTVFG
jgi:hypothetical protein